MSYEALFRNSGVADAVQTAQTQIAQALQNAGRSLAEFTATARLGADQLDRVEGHAGCGTS